MTCSLCNTSPQFRCPGCGRLFCGQHTVASALCADCELALAARVRRHTSWAVAAYLIVVVVITAAVGLAYDNAYWGLLTGLTALAGVGLVVAVARRIARPSTSTWQSVDNLSLTIGPLVELATTWRDLRLAGRRRHPHHVYRRGLDAHFYRAGSTY